MDSIFGQHWNGASYVQKSISTILGAYNTIPTGDNFLKGLYQSEIRARYKELRDNGIFTPDNIIGLLEKWVNACGYDNLKEDIEEIAVSPYIENGQVVLDENGNPVLIPNTPSYRNSFINQEYWKLIDVDNPEYDVYDPSKTYTSGEYVNYYGASYQSKKDVPANIPPTTVGYIYPPASGGWYNSILRVKNWLVQRLSVLDQYYNYNQN